MEGIGVGTPTGCSIKQARVASEVITLVLSYPFLL